jgi:hypothetical protein
MSKRMKFFKPEDFDEPKYRSGNETYFFSPHDLQLIAARANAKLEREGARVTGSRRTDVWVMSEMICKQPVFPDTHQALLVCIEELPKEPCKHEPQFGVVMADDEGTIDFSKALPVIVKCKHCGVELVAEWKERK